MVPSSGNAQTTSYAPFSGHPPPNESGYSLTQTSLTLSVNPKHARKALQIYRERREAFAFSLQIAFGDAIEFEAPKGGLAFWVKFRDPAVLDKIEENAASRGIKFLPSRCFATPPHNDRGLRLGFGSFEEGEAEEAIRKLRALANC
jgi:GntR family transcriptional regulator/MocR family aminotransferase